GSPAEVAQAWLAADWRCGACDVTRRRQWHQLCNHGCGRGGKYSERTAQAWSHQRGRAGEGAEATRAPDENHPGRRERHPSYWAEQRARPEQELRIAAGVACAWLRRSRRACNCLWCFARACEMKCEASEL